MSDAFRTQCRVLRVATAVVLAGLVVLVLSGVGSVPFWLDDGLGPLTGPQRWQLRLVNGLPAIGYLWALWSVQRALGDLAAGRTFHPTVARAMRHIGGGVLAGTLLEVFVVTNLARLVVGHGSYLYFNTSAIVLGVVGAALVLLARLVDRARALQAELDEIL
jgi:hypothetical protein